MCPRFFSLVFFFFDFHFFPSRTTFLSLARGETLPPPSIGIPAALLFERKKKKKKMSLELDCSLSLVFFFQRPRRGVSQFFFLANKKKTQRDE